MSNHSRKEPRPYSNFLLVAWPKDIEGAVISFKEEKYKHKTRPSAWHVPSWIHDGSTAWTIFKTHWKKIVLTLFSPFSQDARTLESNHDSDQGKMYLGKIVQDIYKLFDIFHQKNFPGYELVATTSDGKNALRRRWSFSFINPHA